MANFNAHITTGEPPTDRTIFTILSLIWLMVMSLLLGLRLPKFRKGILLKRNPVSILVFVMNLLVLMFLVVCNVLVAGQGLYTRRLCHAAVWVCLLFYIIIKFIIYIFFVERIHIVRAPFYRRRNDKIYLSCMTMIVVMYNAVAIHSYIDHVWELRRSDGRCHLGIVGVVSIPVTVVNSFMEMVLTMVFFYLLRPVVRKSGASRYAALMGKGAGRRDHVDHGVSNTPLRKSIRTLLWKSLIGGMLIEIPTAANMIQFVITKGRTLGMICLTICMFDVCWGTLVMHWLLFGASSSAAERNIMQSASLSMEEPLPDISQNTESRLWYQKKPKILWQNMAWNAGHDRAGMSDWINGGPQGSSSDLARPSPARL